MIGFAAKALWARKLRTALTAVAIVLGVAMVSGTYVLTDSIDEAFDRIFGETRATSNAVVTGKSAFDLSQEGPGFQPPPFDEGLLDEVKAVPSVEAAEGGVFGEAQIIGRDGKAVVVGGAPNLGFSVDPDNARFNSLTLIAGEWPRANQVAIDETTAERENYEIGDTIGVQAEGSAEQLRMVGMVKFGSVSTIGGATLAAFDLPTAQRLFDRVGELDEIAVAAKPGVANAELVRDIEAILPPGTQVRTGGEQAAEDAEGTDEFITFLRGFLLAFGGIALFVGAFVIANSLSITIAQRTREFATLRTLGGSRRQVLTSIIVEGLIIGVVSSAIGLFLGLALAKLLFWLFDRVGFTLPNTGLLFQPRTIVVSLALGIVVTLIASLRPAWRATRVPPIAAVREGATLPPGRLARFRTAGTLVLAALGFAGIAYGLFRDGLGTTEIIASMGLGAVFVFLGVALFASKLVQPLAEVVSPIATGTVALFSVVFYPVLLGYWLLRYSLFAKQRPLLARLLAFFFGALLVLVLLPVVLVMWLFRRLGWFTPEWPMEPPGNPLVFIRDLLRATGAGSIPRRIGAVVAAVLLSAYALVFLVPVMLITLLLQALGVELRSSVDDPSSRAIARENAKRNPDRTAATAAALMIGLALVTLVAVLGAGIRATFNEAVDNLTRGEFYAITAQNNFSPIPISASRAAESAPGVAEVASVRAGQGQIFGETENVTASTANLGEVMRLEWEAGSPALFARLGDDGAFVEKEYAESNDLRVGSPVQVLTPKGDRVRFAVRGIFDAPPGGSPFGAVTFSSAVFDEHYDNPKNLYTFVTMDGGVTDGNEAALESALSGFPNAKVADGEEFKENQAAGLNAILNILYVLLALSVIVSLFGIVNTLVLTVFERTRELGMLRAIGMTRRQVRRMIRHESVVTALIGAALGIALGLAFGGLLVYRVDFIEFTLPVGSLIIFAVAAIFVGIVAAIFPARRAARLNVLEALQYE